MTGPASWSIEYPVREDADSIFVPTELLPRAQPGDVVEIESLDPPVSRRGRVAGPADADPGGEFVTVTLD